MDRRILQFSMAVSLSFLFVIVASAQGVIVPGPCERCPRPPRPVTLPRSLPVKSIKIDTKIAAQVATTHVEQIFRNDTDAVLEGTYLFPIPESASISEFAIWDGDRRLVGEVRSREEARRIYDEIVRRQRDPGLLEYAGKDLFQASIFPIPPRSDKKLELTYNQVLQAESGTVAYRYPLGVGRQLTQIGNVSGRVEIESKVPLRNIYSPSHAIDTKRNGERRSVLTFESTGKEPQDFQLFYGISQEDFGVSLLTHREPGKDGYFLLMISPKSDWSEQEYSAKDIVFVLDTSGSMSDEGKMEKARQALLYGIRILRPVDRFNVVAFAGVDRIVENIAKARIPGARLFTFGVGYDVNTALLDKLAAENGGVADYVEPKEDLEVKVSNFFAKINYPVLADLKLEMPDVQTDLIYPRNLPDLFRGSQLTLIGRYRNPVALENVRLLLSGTSNGKSRSVFYDKLRFPLREESNDFLPRLWATRRVGWLMTQVRTNGEQKELIDEIVDLGTRYGIVTPYTSYLALEPGGTVREITAVNGRRDSSVGGVSNMQVMTAPKAADARAVTGSVAVQQSKRARAQQEMDRIEKDTALVGVVKNVGNKTFYLRDGVWVDSEFKEDAKLPETKLSFSSDEYFDLLKRKPVLAQYFSLGEQIVLVFEGRVYRVSK